MKAIKLFPFSLAAALMIAHSTTTLARESNAPTSGKIDNALSSDLLYTDFPHSLEKTNLSMSDFLESERGSQIFVNALKKTNVWHRLQNDSISLFVVSDLAMEREGSAFLLEQVLLERENSRRLNELMEFHVATGEVPYGSLSMQSTKITTSNDHCVFVDRLGSATKVGPEAFITKTIKTANGTIHYLDRLLWQKYNGVEDCSFV